MIGVHCKIFHSKRLDSADFSFPDGVKFISGRISSSYMSEYINLRLGSFTIHHGYDQDIKSIEEYVKVEEFSEKIVKLDRILSFTEKTVLIGSGYGREIYWEYEGGLARIKTALLDRLIPTS